MADLWDQFPDATPAAAPAASDPWADFPDVDQPAPRAPMGPFQPPEDSVVLPVRDGGLMGGPQAAIRPAPGFFGRQKQIFDRNRRSEFYTGTIAGAGANVGTGGRLYTPDERAIYDNPADTKLTRAADNPLLALADRISAASGAIVGTLPTPETFFGPGKLAGRIVAKMGIKGPVAQVAAREAVENAIVNTATDPAVQGLNIEAGLQDQYNPAQTAMAPVVGGVAGGGIGAGRGVVGGKMAERRLNRDAQAAGEKFAADIQAAAQDQPLALPSPAMVQSAPMSEAEIAIARARLQGGQRGGAGQAPADPPDVIFGQQGPDAAGLTRDDIAAQREANKVIPLPAPERVTPQMSEAEIAIAQARMNRGQKGAPAQEPMQEPPDTLAGGVDRAPQTRDDVQGQREADEAFRLAERQRERLAQDNDSRDTQAAGRPQGVGDAAVYLDEDFPVRILERRFVPDARGGGVEVARVQRYDPRTGALDPEAVEYDIPVRSLRRRQYAPEPRQAQDFTDRAEGPITPEQPRMPNQGVQRDPEQTFRATAPDNNADFPDAGPGRSPFPEQPDGPGPYRTESEAEAAFREAEARRARGEQDQAEAEARAQAEQAYKGQKASNKPQGKDKTGNWRTDDYGYVRSDQGGPIRFGDQKQAAKWIIKQGQKDTDQLFDIATHPAGPGYTVRQRGTARRADNEGPRAENASGAPPRGKSKGPEGPPRQLAGPPGTRAEPDAPDRPADPGPAPAPGREKSKANLKRTPLSLAGFIRKNGGIKDPGGDLRSMDLQNIPRLRGLINNKSGVDPDRMRKMAQEAGYLPPDPDNAPNTSGVNDLLDLIGEEARGRKIYSAADQNEVDAMNADRQAGAEADQTDLARDKFKAAADEIGVKLSDDELDDIMRGAGDRDPADAIDEYLEQAGRDYVADLEARYGDDDGQGPGGSDRAGGAAAEKPENIQRGQGRTAGDDQGSAPRPPKAPREEGSANARSAGEEEIPGFDLDDPGPPASKRGTFYSNPFADPALLYDHIIRPVMGWSKKAFTDYMDDIREAIGIFSEGKGTKQRMLSTTSMTPVVREIKALHNLIFHTTSQRMRTIGKIFKSETAQRVADMFDATGRKGVGETFDAALNRVRTQRQNQMVKILGDMASKPKKFQKDLEQIAKMIRSGARVEGKLGKQADALRDMLAQHLKYLRDAGIEVGEVKNYFPRMPDMNKVLRDKEGFLRQASKFFKAEYGLDTAKADEAAQDWLGKIMTGFSRSSIEDFAPDANLPKTRHTKGRVLSAKADEFMKDYLVNDPVDALMQYFNSTSRQAEWARRMGVDLSKWNDMKAQMKAEGVSDDAINKIGNLAAVSAGMPSFSYLPHQSTNALNWLKVMANLGALEKATFSSLAEMVVPGLKTGNPGLILMSVKDTLEQLLPGAKVIKSIQDKEDFAEDIGLIQEGMRDAALMAARSAQLDNPSRAQNFVQSKFFQTNYLEQFTRSTRIAAGNVSRVLLRKYARDVARGGAGAKSAALRLQEWGIPAADVQNFAKWLNTTQKGMPGVMDMTGKNGDYYRTAVHRIVDQSIMRPNASTKPVWANDPLGSLVFQLQAYSYAFHQNIIMPALADAGKAVNPKNGFDALDRARMLAPMSYVAALPLLQYAVGELRDSLFGDKQWLEKQEKEDAGKPWWAQSKTMRAFSRGGGFGKYDALYNTITGARFRKKFVESQTGVAVNFVSRLADSLSNLFFNNAPGTETTEENVAEAMYQALVEPTVAAAISVATPTALRPAGFAALQASGAKEVQKEVFVKPVARVIDKAIPNKPGKKSKDTASPWN